MYSEMCHSRCVDAECMVLTDVAAPRFWTRVRFGTNILIGPTTTSSAVMSGGFRLFEARLREDGRLFLSADLYGAYGRRLGAFTSHVWQTQQRDADVYVAPTQVDVRDRETGRVLLSVRHRDIELVVTSMDLRTRDGKRCALDPSGRLAVWPEHHVSPQWRHDIVWETALDRIELLHVTNTEPVPSRRFAEPRGLSKGT
jgi:hypothetical protein